MVRKLQNVNEVADYLNVSPKTLYQWAELHQIPHVKINGCLRFDAEAIENWIETCKHDANGAK